VRNTRTAVCLFLALASSGCASLEFDAKTKPGLTYFEPVPYLAVTTTTDCKMTAAVLVLPGDKKMLSFHSGYGSADLSASVANGMLQAVGQKTDTKIPETITALAGVATALGVRAEGAKETCEPRVRLFSIDGGKPGAQAVFTVSAK